jgi:hypothetical protein
MAPVITEEKRKTADGGKAVAGPLVVSFSPSRSGRTARRTLWNRATA